MSLYIIAVIAATSFEYNSIVMRMIANAKHDGLFVGVSMFTLCCLMYLLTQFHCHKQSNICSINIALHKCK